MLSSARRVGQAEALLHEKDEEHERDQEDEENDLSAFKGDDENGDYEGREEEDLGYLD